MKNILKVFLIDFSRINTNVVAVVVILGLAIIPSLYAWFNIMSNWDPYGPDATGNMKIAVYSGDEGIDESGVKINIGDKVIDGLRGNKTIGWVFCDSEKEALGGVYSSDYYAALIIPEGFSQEMISFINGDIEHPQIKYYENEKKNAIAPKITDSAKSAVQEEINSTFISTMVDLSAEAGSIISSRGNNNSLLSSLQNVVDDIDADLLAYINTMDSYVNITNAACALIDTTQVVIPYVNDTVDSGGKTISSINNVAIASGGAIDAATNMMEYSFRIMKDSLNQVVGMLDDASQELPENKTAALQDLKRAGDTMKYINDIYDNTAKGVEAALNGVGSYNADSYISQLKKGPSSLEDITGDVDELQDKKDVTQEEIDAANARINSEIAACITELDQLQSQYNSVVKPALDSTVASISRAMSDARASMGSFDKDFNGIMQILEKYGDVIKTGNRSVVQSRDMAVELEAQVAEISKNLRDLNDSGISAAFEKLAQDDPEQLGKFLASPVAIQSKALYPISNYGSAMAPFYSILAIWVGALILVAILHTEVKDRPELQNVTMWQKYFGRYITFFLIGQVQATITTMGTLFYVGIQCVHPVMLWFATSVCSFVFTLMMYSLTVAFGNIGEAIAVIIMVLQVAGAGGTFPIEVLPKVYQAIYKFLPFTYGMSAMKESIAGLYNGTYWNDIGILMIFAAVSLFVGLVMAIPFRRVMEIMESSKAKTDLMI